MTVSNAIIRWLKTFNPEEYWKMEHIDTDLMHGGVDYALVKAPVRNVKSYLSGTKVITDHFTIEARLPSTSNADCVDNEGFGAALEQWVEEQNQVDNLPAVEGAEVQRVDITTPFCVGRTADNHSIYEMSVGITYVKENGK